MRTDIRESAARYFDLSPRFPEDIPFYRLRIPSPEARILELGCGTGRVLVALAGACGSILGVDASEAMLSICREKLREKQFPPSKASLLLGDITDLNVGRQFDLIIAPFRVFQNLESEREVEGFFDTIRKHLAQKGEAILNTFMPNMPPERLRREWCSQEERLAWEVPVEGGKVTLHDRRRRMDRERLVLYPELVYRRYEGETLVDEQVLAISMRCYYPEGLAQLVRNQGFRVVGKWGGYGGEPYGKGPELVLAFTQGD